MDTADRHERLIRTARYAWPVSNTITVAYAFAEGMHYGIILKGDDLWRCDLPNAEAGFEFVRSQASSLSGEGERGREMMAA